METWVLILLLAVGNQGFISTAEFSSEQTCKQAVESARAVLGAVVGICTPK